MRVPVLALAVGFLVLGCGEPPVDERPYPARFELAGDLTGRDVTRDQDYVDVIVQDATCSPPGGASQAAERFLRAEVQTEPDALVVTIYMLPEEQTQDDCAGIGQTFAKRVRLPRPIGPLGIVDGAVGTERHRIVLAPRGRDAIRALGRRHDYSTNLLPVVRQILEP